MISLAFLAVAGLLSCLPPGQQQQAAPLAIPAQIVAAKNVFVSNGGVDSASPVVLERAVGPNDPYNQFFVAIESMPGDMTLWRRLLTLIWFLSCGLPQHFLAATHQPLLALAILDTKTRVRLRTLTTRVGDAHRKGAWDRNLKGGIDNLVDDFRQLATQPAVARR